MSFFLNKLNQKISYKSTKGAYPGLIFIHGLNSDKDGLKSKNIEKYAKKNNISFLCFDFRGHGKSHGKFEDFTISDWKEDLIDIIDNLTKGPQILIGSSMGGWLMMLAAKIRSDRIVGLIGLAAAVDFGSQLYKNLSNKNKKEIKKNGITKYSSYGFSYSLRTKFFLDAKKNKILNKKFRYKRPIILIHGFMDNVVNINMPKKIMNIYNGNNFQIIYLKSSDHRLSSYSDLITINNSIDNIRALI